MPNLKKLGVKVSGRLIVEMQLLRQRQLLAQPCALTLALRVEIFLLSEFTSIEFKFIGLHALKVKKEV